MIIFRIAKVNDSKEIAKLHYICASKQVDGFMHKLGVRFLIKYYRIFLNEKNSLIVVAENDGKIIGFISGTMYAEEHQFMIKKNKILLGVSIIPALIRDFKILGEVIKRFTSLNTKENDFRVKSGTRGEYWAWNPNLKDSFSSLKLHKIWHDMMRELGATCVRSEVDLANKRVVSSIKLMGGIFIEEITLLDGRKRAIVEYKL